VGFFRSVFGLRDLPPARRPVNMDAASLACVSLRHEPTLAPGRRPEQLVAPARAFTPTQPRHGRRQLVGRQSELTRILQALQEDRAHVVLYAERGRGKTSLTNMVVETLRQGDVVVARHTCDADSNFDSILRGLMRDLPSSLLAAQECDVNAEGCEQALPNRELRPGDAVSLPTRLLCRSLVCVIDEFDRVEDPATRTRIADAIKQLSDRDVDLRFLIVGVSENLDQILGQHPSIQRNVLGVHLPLFTDRDVSLLIAKGARETGFSFMATAVARIAGLARGMPYMAQLLALRLAQAAAQRGDTFVSGEDFDTAVQGLLADANPRVLVLYSELTGHGQNSDMIAALRQIATAPQDPWGRLTVLQADTGGVSIGGRAIPATCWARLQEAHVLQSYGSSSGLYVFAERSLMHHVLLLAAHDVPAAATDVADSSAEPQPEVTATVRPLVLHPFASRAFASRA
jgi:hypothetical protein